MHSAATARATAWDVRLFQVLFSPVRLTASVMSKSSVKFGLVGSASSLKKGAAGKARPIGSKPAPRRRPPGATAVFDAHSDDEDESRTDPSGVAAVNKRLAAISAKQEKQAKKEYEDALEADPSVFDYDRVYDGMQDRCVP